MVDVASAHFVFEQTFPLETPGGGHDHPLQYSCLENPMDRGAWWGYSPWGCKELDTTEPFSFTSSRNLLVWG